MIVACPTRPHRRQPVFAPAELLLIVLGLAVFILAAAEASGGQESAGGCRVLSDGPQVRLCSPLFVFRLDTAAGLRAATWENRLTGGVLDLGEGPELEADIGLPDRPVLTPPFTVSSTETTSEGEGGEAVFRLKAEAAALTAVVRYRWNATDPVLHKFVEIRNVGDHDLDRLLNVRLGTYRTGPAAASAEPGFPAYVRDEFFLTLAHPAGWATATDSAGQNGVVSLRQYPGKRLAPGGRFASMEAVYGVAKAGRAHQAFVAEVRSRMRRVLRHHDKPYAIFEAFGGKPDGSFEESERYVLDNIAQVAQGQRDSGCHFDFYSVDFWVDYDGDLKRFDPLRFPHGFQNIGAALARLGTAPALWIDSSWAPWSIGGNPAVQPTMNWGPGKDVSTLPFNRRSLCRATEPIRSLYTEAFRHHIRHNGARLLKFDNFAALCMNPDHEHLPGIYSTEPIEEAAIEFLRALDAECPDVFLMLYWGYGSPWWLRYGDTLFESGIDAEAANPSELPALSARNTAVHQVDQAQWHATLVRDIPPLGRDSLGVWLSNWPWNNQIGKDRWQGGLVMDLCRGNLLAQIWTDQAWLSPPERKQLAEFIALFKARPECFGNSRFVVGDPWKDEPYGYCCTDGKRAFLALHNACWHDSRLPLELNPAWGLRAGRAWDLYRWYPDPAQLKSASGGPFGEKTAIALRPFDIVLLEVVEHGQSASLGRSFPSRPLPLGFAEATRPLLCRARRHVPGPDTWEASEHWTVLKPVEARSAGGAALGIQPDGSILAGGRNPWPDTYSITAHTDMAGITAIRLETMTDPSLPLMGPGRASDGNFILDEFSATAWPRGTREAARPVAFHDPAADHAESYPGIRPIAAAIDGDARTGWSIHPEEGLPHAAVFPIREPLGDSRGTTLQFTIRQGSVAGGNLGRLRLAVAAAKAPLTAPRPAAWEMAIESQVPASQRGGTVVICAQFVNGGRRVHVGGVGKLLLAIARLAGQNVNCRPVLGSESAASWQTWRIDVGPSGEPRLLSVKIDAAIPSVANLECSEYFIPQ